MKTDLCAARVVWTVALVFALACVTQVRADDAGDLLAKLGERQGICLIVGCGDAQLPMKLAAGSEFMFFISVETEDQAAAVRQAADDAGLLGTRVYISNSERDKIGLGANLADAAIVIEPAEVGDSLRAEIERVLRPGAVAVLADGSTFTKELPRGVDEWSHPYHGPDNNPQSTDEIARGPYLTKFLAEPWYGPMPEVTVASGGRLFKAFGHISFKEREWPLLNKLYCLNAYNGTLLWTRDLVPGFMIHRNTMIATPEALYLADNDSCKVIDAKTGEVLKEIHAPDDVAKDGTAWKWMALQDGVLYAMLGNPDPLDETLKGVRKTAGWPWNELGKMYDPGTPYQWGFGRTLLAIDLKSGELRWRHSESEDIDGRAVCMNGERLFYYCPGKHVAALDIKSGEPVWKSEKAEVLEGIGPDNRAQNPSLGYSTTAYIKCSDKAVFFAGPQRDRLVAVSAENGDHLWTHPAGNYQLVLRDDGLYAMGRTDESKLFDPLTGDVLADLNCYRGNCTRATGTIDAIFSRGHPHTGTLRLDLSSSEAVPTRIALMRPACQDGVIVHHGQLFWGPWMCDCNLQLVGVISLTATADVERQALESTTSLTPESVSEQGRLLATSAAVSNEKKFSPTESDWPTYRANNSRSSFCAIDVASDAKTRWTYKPKSNRAPTAPVAAGGLIFLSGDDGAVRAVDAKDGSAVWTAYTGGPIKYPPAIADGRAFVGSCDGHVYSFDAATGKLLWRFRAAPLERTIPVYGTLSSTWPVASGVLVDGDTVYAAAGIASYDGTHVYALDAASGRLKWHNGTSGRLTAEEDRVTGISVQGHLLLHNGVLHMPGGNVVSPARYDAMTGKCLNVLGDEWDKGPRGRELFLVDDQVMVFDQLLYSPPDYQPGRYFSQDFFVQAGKGEFFVRGVIDRIVRLDPRESKPGQPQAMWQSTLVRDIAALAVTKNAVLASGVRGDDKGGFVLAALDVESGEPLWTEQLPAAPASWCLAVDRDGRVLVSLRDGRVVCVQ